MDIKLLGLIKLLIILKAIYKAIFLPISNSFIVIIQYI